MKYFIALFGVIALIVSASGWPMKDGPSKGLNSDRMQKGHRGGHWGGGDSASHEGRGGGGYPNLVPGNYTVYPNYTIAYNPTRPG